MSDGLAIEAYGASDAVLAALQFQIQRAARLARMQKDALNFEGDLALSLIQSATIDPAVGQHLDIAV